MYCIIMTPNSKESQVKRAYRFTTRIPVKLLDHIVTIPLFEGLSRGQHEALARITVSRSYRNRSST